MSGKYVPPAMRNRKHLADEQKLKVPSPDEFPTLGSSKPKTAFKPVRSFALLASEWQDHEDEEKSRKEILESMGRREAERRENENRNVYVYRQSESHTDDYQVDDDRYQPNPSGVDDWTTIEKKAKRELTLEEQYDKKLRMEEEEKRMADESVWNDHNDDWDYRDRRAYS
jgi:hypothetical protein